jgi:predicted ATPase
MVPCHCHEPHAHRRIVLTGGPGAGKTAILELIRHHFCRHVAVLPESASLLFRGGFPRGSQLASRAATQRAIYRVQVELEAVAESENGSAVVLCDRGTVDGFAYWPGPGDFWSAVETDRARELQRYAVVIHLRVPPASEYDHRNPERIESPAEAEAIDARIALAWDGHPRMYRVDHCPRFMDKAQMTLDILRAEMPPCCLGQEPSLHLGGAGAGLTERASR